MSRAGVDHLARSPAAPDRSRSRASTELSPWCEGRATQVPARSSCEGAARVSVAETRGPEHPPSKISAAERLPKPIRSLVRVMPGRVSLTHGDLHYFATARGAPLVYTKAPEKVRAGRSGSAAGPRGAGTSRPPIAVPAT